MKLYVGKLPPHFDNKALEALFSEFGKIVSVNVIMDRETGRSKCFGFVEFESKENAEAAIKALNGKTVEGTQLVVNEARPMQKRDNRRDAPPFRKSFR